MSEIKPCPFCDGKPYAQENGRLGFRYWEVVCDNECDFTGPAKNTKDEAVEAWNRRPALAAKDADIENLRSRWQPIETAPRDGTLIILHDSVRVASGVGRWRQVSSRDTLNDIDGLAQFSREYGWRSASDKSIENATHWMPLPDAPKGGDA